MSVGTHNLAVRYNGFTYLTSSGSHTHATGMSETQTITIVSAAASETTLSAQTSATSSQFYDLAGIVFGYGPMALNGTVTFNDATANVVMGSLAIERTRSQPGFG